MPSPLFTNVAPGGVQIAQTQVPQIPVGLQVAPVDVSPAFKANEAMIQRAILAERKHQFDQGILKDKNTRSPAQIADLEGGLDVQYARDAQIQSELVKEREKFANEATNMFVRAQGQGGGRPTYDSEVAQVERMSESVARGYDREDWRKEVQLNNRKNVWEKQIEEARKKGLEIDDNYVTQVRDRFAAYKNDLSGGADFDPNQFNLSAYTYDAATAMEDMNTLADAAVATFEVSDLEAMADGSGVVMEQIREQSVSYQEAVDRVEAGLLSNPNALTATSANGKTAREQAKSLVDARMNRRIDRIKKQTEARGFGDMARKRMEIEARSTEAELKRQADYEDGPGRLAHDHVTKMGEETTSAGAFQNALWGASDEYYVPTSLAIEIDTRLNGMIRGRMGMEAQNRQFFNDSPEGNQERVRFAPRSEGEGQEGQANPDEMTIQLKDNKGNWFVMGAAPRKDSPDAPKPFVPPAQRTTRAQRTPGAVPPPKGAPAAPSPGPTGRITPKNPEPISGSSVQASRATQMPTTPTLKDYIWKHEGAYNWQKEEGARSVYDISLGYGKYRSDNIQGPISQQGVDEVMNNVQRGMINNQRSMFAATKAAVERGDYTWEEAAERGEFVGTLQEDNTRTAGASSALGPYQLTNVWLRDMKRKHPAMFEGNPKFDGQFQDALFNQWLEDNGIRQAISGDEQARNKFLSKVAKTWSSIPDPLNGGKTIGNSDATMDGLLAAWANTSYASSEPATNPQPADAAEAGDYYIPTPPMALRQDANTPRAVAPYYNQARNAVIAAPLGQRPSTSDELVTMAFGATPAIADGQMSRKTKELVTDYRKQASIAKNTLDNDAGAITAAQARMKEIEAKFESDKGMKAQLARASSAAIIPLRYYEQAARQKFASLEASLKDPDSSVVLKMNDLPDIDGDGKLNSGEVVVAYAGPDQGYAVTVTDSKYADDRSHPGAVTNVEQLSSMSEVYRFLGSTASNALLASADRAYRAERFTESGKGTTYRSQPPVDRPAPPKLPKREDRPWSPSVAPGQADLSGLDVSMFDGEMLAPGRSEAYQEQSLQQTLGMTRRIMQTPGDPNMFIKELEEAGEILAPEAAAMRKFLQTNKINATNVGSFIKPAETDAGQAPKNNIAPAGSVGATMTPEDYREAKDNFDLFGGQNPDRDLAPPESSAEEPTDEEDGVTRFDTPPTREEAAAYANTVPGINSESLQDEFTNELLLIDAQARASGRTPREVIDADYDEYLYKNALIAFFAAK